MKPAHLSFRLCLLGTMILMPLFVVSSCDISDSNGGRIETTQNDDPIVVDFPIAYVERPLPTDEDGEFTPFDIMEQTAFHPGARLILKDRAAASARETVITAGIFDGLELDPETGEEISLYDVKDLEVSADGKKLIFAMRAPDIEGLDDDEQPTWNIWEYDFDSDEPQPHRIISLSLPIEAEKGHDISPHYLPNGRIVFSSTRQSRTRAILLDEGKTQYAGLDDKRNNEAMVLHTMNDDGSDIKQISFNVSHDMQPSVLSTGEIIFLRWDAMNGHDELSLYKSDQDGNNVQLYYGFHTQNTGTNASDGVFMNPRELPDGRIVVNLQPRASEALGGDIVAIDVDNFIANNQATTANAGAIGPAQESLISTSIDTSGDAPSPGGFFSSVYPLDDGSNRLLVSWSQCRLIDPTTDLAATCSGELIAQNAEQATPLFGLWIYNPSEGTQLPIKPPQPDLMFTDAVVISPKSTIPDDIRTTPTELTDTLLKDRTGVIHIRSVYDIDGVDSAPNGTSAVADPTQTPTDSRPARFLRIVKNVPMPDDDILDFDNAIFGRSRNQLMKDIVGYVPVEPDGSAMFTVPAEIPIMIDILDGNGRRINQRHEIWTYLQPGEEKECTGCHTNGSELPHGRMDAEAPSINLGAVGGTPFPGTTSTDTFAVPASGQTMAQFFADSFGPRVPSVDIVFTDDWTDTTLTPATPGFSWRYIDITTALNNNPADTRCQPLDVSPQLWQAPTTCGSTSWTSLCRITINYPDTIQPLWTADRRTCDAGGNVVQDITCTSCHSNSDDLGNPRLPSGQLELTGEISADRNDYITSYAELMFQDNVQELVDGSLADVVNQVPTGEFERLPPAPGETLGALVLDANGNPIEIIDLVTVPTQVPMSTNGANASTRFFPRFTNGGTHAGYLSPAELKLISEWLDIGGQYYNNPFDAPAN